MKTREEIIDCLKNFFKEKAQHYGLEMTFLYGSWAGGFPKEDSDVDVAIIFTKEPDSDNELFGRINDISLSLSKELGREINTIPIRSDFNKPMLYYNAIVLGIPVFIKDGVKHIRLKNEAIFQMEDFNLFGIDWQLRVAKKNLEELKHDYRYAKGRIAESIQYISQELKEFEDEYVNKTWNEYREDKKLQKLMDRTVENILTALIEVCGTLLTEEGIPVESYSDALRKCSKYFGFSEEEQENLARLAIQRNRLAHRYLNFRWQAIKMFNEQKELVINLISVILEREERKK